MSVILKSEIILFVVICQDISDLFVLFRNSQASIPGNSRIGYYQLLDF